MWFQDVHLHAAHTRLAMRITVAVFTIALAMVTTLAMATTVREILNP